MDALLARFKSRRKQSIYQEVLCETMQGDSGEKISAGVACLHRMH